MSSVKLSRRNLLLSSLYASAAAVRTSRSLVAATLLFSTVEQALAAHEGMVMDATLSTLSELEAVEFAAIAARIIPTDDTPGATEAGAIHFMDKVLGTSRPELLEPLLSGLDGLQAMVLSTYGAEKFSLLTPVQQDALLADIDNTSFFATLRFLTICGTFALPEYGGNRDMTGYQLIGFDHRHAWTSPFGYYDGDYMLQGE